MFKVPYELNYIKADEVLNHKLHESRVMGVYFDSNFSLLHTISEDKFYKAYNISKNEEVCKIQLGQAGLTYLKIDEDFKRAFISSRNGNVYVLDIFRV